jgi:hypothetical protein
MQAVGATKLSASAETMALETEIAGLERRSLGRLRDYWSARWGYAPRLRSPILFRHLIA